MASKAALVVLALAAGTAAAADPINTDKYTAIAEAGACRGNGGSSDKVNSKYKLGLTQAECETECDSISTCLGYAYQTGASDVASAYCLIHGPGLAGSCSDAALDTQEKCEAKGTCSIATVQCADSGTYCLGVEEACTNLGGTWTKSATTVWTATSDNGWEGDSHPTTHIAAGNGNADYTCFDIDPDDHDATCVNGDSHASPAGNHAGYKECAANWTDTSVSGCVNIEGCPATPCNSDDSEAWCCNAHVDDCSEWHYCGCERDFEAGGKEESACDTAAGCVYTAAPKMETPATPHPGDALHCDNVYQEGQSGACRGQDSSGGQVSTNQKYSKSCNADGTTKVCGGTDQPACEMTQAECEAGCAAENAIAPGRCQAYHHKPGGWCTMFGPTIHEGIGWEANPTCVEPASAGPGTCESAFTAASGTAEADCNTAGGCVYSKGAAAADSCWSYWSSGYTEVTGTNTNIEYMCFMLKDTTVNNVCGSPSSDGAAAQTLAFGAALAAGLLA